MRLGEFMKSRVVTIGAGEKASAAWSRMRDRRIRHLVVTENGKVVGVISQRDLGGIEGAELRRNRLVRELMTPRPRTATPTTTLREAAALMREGPIGSLPVVDGGQLAGIVTATDVLDELGRTSAGRNPPYGRRAPTPDSRHRAPFLDRLPRAYRRGAGRTAAPVVPTYILARGVELSPNDREYIRRKLGRKLGKFPTAIERVSVRVEDVNGPRGGIDHVCRIKVVMPDRPSMVVDRRAASLRAAVDSALAAIERAVRRDVQRRRTGSTGARRRVRRASRRPAQP
jgi:CBS domain-containing protein/ribosome-associated translation inhibitor RaiA